MEKMDESTAWAFMHNSAAIRKEFAKNIEQLKKHSGTKDMIDRYIDAEIIMNDLYGIFGKEIEVLKHAEAKCG